MALRSGQDIPERIANCPKLYESNRFYLECFYDIIDQTDWSTIVSYGIYYNLEYETVENLLIILPRLQIEYNKLRDKFKNAG